MLRQPPAVSTSLWDPSQMGPFIGSMEFINPQLSALRSHAPRVKFGHKLSSKKSGTLSYTSQEYRKYPFLKKRSVDHENVEIPVILSKRKKKPYPISIKKIKQAAKADRKLVEKGLEKPLEPRKNGLLVTDLTPVVHEVLDAWKILMKGLAHLLHVIPVYACRAEPRPDTSAARASGPLVTSTNEMKTGIRSIVEKGSSYVFSQNSKITQLGKSGRIDEAIEVFSRMNEKNTVTYNSMISAYAKNGRIQDARQVFDQMPHRNVVSWNSMIAGYLHNDLVDQAAKLFNKMRNKDLYSWTLMITGYTRIAVLEKARELFNLLPDKQDTVCYNALIAGYAKKRQFDEAKKLFDKMPVKNIVSWNSMLSGYTKNGEMHLGLQFFEAMGERNIVSWNLMVDGFIEIGDFDSAWMFFKKIPTPNAVSWVTMFSGFARYGRITEARNLFNQMPSKNLVSWNAMIGAYVRSNQTDEAFQLFMAMPERDSVSWTTMINGCVRDGKLSQAREIMDLMPYKNIAAQTAMMNGYVHCSRMDEANEIFSQISVRDSVCWNTMIAGYTQCGRMDDALSVFEEMTGKDLVSWNTMIAGYSQAGQMDTALGLFNEMPERNIVSWNTLITGYLQNDLYLEALEGFILMIQQGKKPDQSTFVICLRASANLSALKVGMQLHHLSVKTGFVDDLFVKNAVITVYAKCGRVLDAESIFNEINDKDVVSWNSLVAGYALNGYGKEAVKLFEEMLLKGVVPNEVTFTGLLSACNHGGFVDHGLKLFECMTKTYSIKPLLEHYACAIDLLGRVGRLEEAMEVVKGMKMAANARIWGSLLGACRKHQNLELAKYSAEKLLELEPQNASNYVLLSNMHAEVGRWDMVERVRGLMEESRAEKQPGCSWIEITSQMHCFLSEAPSESRKPEICNVLKTLAAQAQLLRRHLHWKKQCLEYFSKSPRGWPFDCYFVYNLEQTDEPKSIGLLEWYLSVIST